MRLENKVILVTGAGKGIGKGLAMEIGKAGADVAMTYNVSATGANEVAAELQKLGRRTLAIRADLGKVADARRAVEETVKAFGRLDVLVYNSGITDPHPYLEITEEEYDRTLDINLKGCFFTAQAAARVMVDQGIAGRIIVISSLHSILSFPDHAHYAASKGGINAFMRTIANELAPYDIRVNAVIPGGVEVEKSRADPDYDPAKSGPTIPLRRWGYPSDIAKAVIFLASEDADYMTGSIMTVDGGIMTRSPHHMSVTYPDLRKRT